MPSNTQNMEDTFSENSRGGRRQMDTEPGMVPWQIRAIIYMGVPAAIACFLVWFVTQVVLVSLNAQQSLLSAQQTTLNSLAQSTSTLQGEHSQIRMVNEAMLKVLQASCANDAKTMENRANCFR